MFAPLRPMKRVISPISQRHSRGKGRSRLLARIDGLRDRGDWKANGTDEIAAEKTRHPDGLCHRLVSRCDQTPEFFIRQAKSDPLVGLATRRESSNVCMYRED
jgi:hypothetical protein